MNAILPLLLPLLMLVILFVCMATLAAEGMWSNAIRLINTVTAALLAVNFFEPAARWMDEQAPAATYVYDFVALWGLFIIFTLVFRGLTDRLSRVKVRFLMVVDQIGGGFFAFWTGWVLICFTMMTLHTAPLARNFLHGGFQPEQRMVFRLAPDRQWLGFVQKMSLGTFCRWGAPEDWRPGEERFVFDPNGDFMPKYKARRESVESLVKENNSFLVGGGQSGG